MILNYMEISILLAHLPSLEQAVIDKDGIVILGNDEQPLLRKLDFEEIAWKPNYALVYDLKESLKTCNELVIKSYVKTLIEKLNKISKNELQQLYTDYFNGKLIHTDPYILI